MSSLTPERIAEIRERANAATPGPWGTQGGSYACIYSDAGVVGDIVCEPPEGVEESLQAWPRTSEFIAHARQDVPELLDALEAAEAEVARLREDKARLLEAAEELLLVANLRGDTVFDPVYDPKPWTARMQTAWEDLDAAIDAARKGGAK